MDTVTLTIHFKNRVRLFYPKHLPGPQLTLAIQKTFDLGSEEEVELLDRLSHERLSLTKLHCLPPNSHLVSTLVLKRNMEQKSLLNTRILSQEKTIVVHRQNGSLGFKVQYLFAPSQATISNPYHKMATVFVKQLDMYGPAAKAGLKQGDRILKVNGVSVFGKSLEDIVIMMKKREDYVVLSTVPWYKDYLQVEYPDLAYSEPESDASTTSLDRFSPHRTPTRAPDMRQYATEPKRAPVTGRCTRTQPPAKPPRPNYVLRRHDERRSHTLDRPSHTLDRPRARAINSRHSYSLDDKSKRFGNLQCFEDFQLPEKPPSGGSSSKEMDPLCEALLSQAEISPSDLQKMTTEEDTTSLEGHLDCKIMDEGSKRHTLRGWTRYFVSLTRSELRLYKNFNEYVEGRERPEEGPVDVSNCLVNVEYRLKKPVFRLTCQTDKEYLFKAESQEEMLEWISVIQKQMDNQSLCNSLIKKKADALLLKTETAGSGGGGAGEERRKQPKVKPYTRGDDFPVNSQYDFPSFGSTIDKCIKCTEDACVPAVVAGCIREVEERGITCTGLYRLSGNEKAINSLINEIDRDPRNVDYKAAPWTDIHNTCAVLKQFFRRLSEPLIPTHLYRTFMEAAELNMEERCERMRGLVRQLPECHRATARLLFRHLAKVAANADTNKMHIYNLAIIFGPTVVRSASNDMVSLVADMSSQYKVVECFIAKYGYIFEDEDLQQVAEVKSSSVESSTTTPAPLTEESSEDNMGIFGQKPYRPSLNGLTTPSDDRASLPTGWEFAGSDEGRPVETSDKSTQCNLPKSPRAEEKIYYRKEPVGIVHPYKDDIKMRPNSRILDKKLVSLNTFSRIGTEAPSRAATMDISTARVAMDTSGRVGMDTPGRVAMVTEASATRGGMVAEASSARGGMLVEGPKKSLSLESLLDMIQTENKKRQLTKRGYSQQFENIQKFVSGLQGRTGRRSPPKTSSSCSSGRPQQPSPVAPPRLQTNLVRPTPHYPRTPLYAIPQRKTSEPEDTAREKPWVQPTPNRQVSRSEDTLGRTSVSAAAAADPSKIRRHSEVRAKWQPGKTHRWVLDNNTTMLESTL